MKTRYLIIGNSTAAINAIEAIRELDKTSGLVVVADEEHHSYSRPLITYLLGHKVEEEQIFYRPFSFYDDNQVQCLLGKRAVHLIPKTHEVILDDQTRLQYEKLLLSTGGTPIVPPLPGGTLSGVFTFTTLNDAYQVRKFIQDHQVKKAVVVGGGLIGLKVTEALLALDLQVTIVELADRILSATFDRSASGIIERALSEIGCSTITGTTVEKILANNEQRVRGVVLKDGRELEADLVILAIGVRPRLDLIQGTGLAMEKGIKVNAYLQTSLPDIYAAGDVIESYDFLSGNCRPMAILPNASAQGRMAGYNMAGGQKPYQGALAMNSIELAGVPTISVGMTDPVTTDGSGRKVEILKEIQEEKSLYKKLVLENNRLIGAILVGKIDRAGIYTGLIKERVDIASYKEYLLREDFGLLSLPKEYRKHLVTGQGIEV